jgi:hypothetical protein
MNTALLGIGTTAATALIGWLAGPAEAVLFGFFGVWGVLLVWNAGRARVSGADSLATDGELETDLPVRR